MTSFTYHNVFKVHSCCSKYSTSSFYGYAAHFIYSSVDRHYRKYSSCVEFLGYLFTVRFLGFVIHSYLLASLEESGHLMSSLCASIGGWGVVQKFCLSYKGKSQGRTQAQALYNCCSSPAHFLLSLLFSPHLEKLCYGSPLKPHVTISESHKNIYYMIPLMRYLKYSNSQNQRVEWWLSLQFSPHPPSGLKRSNFTSSIQF